MSSPSSKFCDICRVSFSSRLDAEAHYSGKKHAKRARLQEHEGDGDKQKICEICQLQFNSDLQKHQHLEGRQHFEALTKWQRERGIEPLNEPRSNDNPTPSSQSSRVTPQKSKSPKASRAKYSPKPEVLKVIEPSEVPLEPDDWPDAFPLECPMCDQENFTAASAYKEHVESAIHKEKAFIFKKSRSSPGRNDQDMDHRDRDQDRPPLLSIRRGGRLIYKRDPTLVRTVVFIPKHLDVDLDD